MTATTTSATPTPQIWWTRPDQTGAALRFQECRNLTTETDLLFTHATVDHKRTLARIHAPKFSMQTPTPKPAKQGPMKPLPG
jgi:hypothetical protein